LKKIVVVSHGVQGAPIFVVPKIVPTQPIQSRKYCILAGTNMPSLFLKGNYVLSMPLPR
jgi:hypothetical protein